MPVVLLVGAIAFEVIGTTCLKYSDGFSKLWPSLGTAAGYVIALFLLGLSLKEIDVSVAYAVWCGVGIAVITLIGIAAFGESADPIKLAGLALIVAGVVAVNLSGAQG